MYVSYALAISPLLLLVSIFWLLAHWRYELALLAAFVVLSALRSHGRPRFPGGLDAYRSELRSGKAVTRLPHHCRVKTWNAPQ